MAMRGCNSEGRAARSHARSLWCVLEVSGFATSDGGGLRGGAALGRAARGGKRDGGAGAASTDIPPAAELHIMLAGWSSGKERLRNVAARAYTKHLLPKRVVVLRLCCQNAAGQEGGVAAAMQAKQGPTSSAHSAETTGDGDGGFGRNTSMPRPGKNESSLANANDGDAADDEGVFMAEYNRWLHLEQNWEAAEQIRNQYMENSQLRKSRDERHRERGMERQAASIEQMKHAKAKVEEHRENNLAQGKAVRDSVSSWKEKSFAEKQAWIEHNRSVKDTILSMERDRAEREALLALKKRITAQVKVEVMQLEEDNKLQKEQVLATNRDLHDRVRSETSSDATDEAKRFMYDQRRQRASEIQTTVKQWEAQRNANKLKFREDAANRRDKSRKIEASARLSRKQLAEKKAAQAEELRQRKKATAKAYRAQLQEHAALVKQVVYSSAEYKFASPAESRRMMQHPHYQEVNAVVTDITSSISKEIASSPHRRPAIACKPRGAK